MAPPTRLFPVSELEQQIQFTTSNLKEKRRKMGKIDLETCELFEMVQYTCTSQEQQFKLQKAGKRETRMECVPFVRLFRRCGKGEKMFHVETTAWEGDHAYKPPGGNTETKHAVEDANAFANSGSYFWSK